ncbi:MAG: DUF697 domain-containing protein [Thiohalocapsa sp.]
MPNPKDTAPKYRGIFGIGDDPDDLPPSTSLDDGIVPATRAAAAENIIKNHVLIALSLGLFPLPIFDVLLLTTNQAKMVYALGRIYGVQPFHKDALRAMIISLASGTLPVAAVLGLSSGLKVVPGIGSLIGSGSVAISGAVLTYAVGRVFVKHFESGGTYLTLNKHKARADLRAEMKKGQGFVSDLAGNANGPQPAKA